MRLVRALDFCRALPEGGHEAGPHAHERTAGGGARLRIRTVVDRRLEAKIGEATVRSKSAWTARPPNSEPGLRNTRQQE